MFQTCFKHVSNGFKTRLNVFQTKTAKKRFTISPLFIWRVTFYSCKSQFREKNPVRPIEKFLFLAQARNTAMLQHLIIHFLLYQPSSGRLQEVKTKGKFQTFSSKSGRGRLLEVVAYKRFQIQ